MPTTYQQLLHSVALRANALIGAQAATLEATYATAVLTSANFKSADFPFTSFRDAILQGEQEFVEAVAFTGNHPWRTAIGGISATIASGGQIPKNEAITGKGAVGLFGAIRDSSDSTLLVEMPIDVVVRRIRNANTHYLIPVYYYKIDGAYIIHTRTAVVFELCIYDRATQVTSFGANGNMLLPDLAESGIVARALSYLFRNGLYAEQATVWRGYSNEALAAIRAGGTSIVSKSIPKPVTNTKAS